MLLLVASMNSQNNPISVFIKGFKNALWAILLDNPGYQYLSIEDISDNKCIIDDIKIKTQPIWPIRLCNKEYNIVKKLFLSFFKLNISKRRPKSKKCEP